MTDVEALPIDEAHVQRGRARSVRTHERLIDVTWDLDADAPERGPDALAGLAVPPRPPEALAGDVRPPPTVGAGEEESVTVEEREHDEREHPGEGIVRGARWLEQWDRECADK